VVFAALCLPFTTVPFSHSIGPSLVARYVCRYYSSVASCLERGIFFLFSFLVIYFYFYFFYELVQVWIRRGVLAETSKFLKISNLILPLLSGTSMERIWRFQRKLSKWSWT